MDILIEQPIKLIYFFTLQYYKKYLFVIIADIIYIGHIII